MYEPQPFADSHSTNPSTSAVASMRRRSEPLIERSLPSALDRRSHSGQNTRQGLEDGCLPEGQGLIPAERLHAAPRQARVASGELLARRESGLGGGRAEQQRMILGPGRRPAHDRVPHPGRRVGRRWSPSPNRGWRGCAQAHPGRPGGSPGGSRRGPGPVAALPAWSRAGAPRARGTPAAGASRCAPPTPTSGAAADPGTRWAGPAPPVPRRASPPRAGPPGSTGMTRRSR